MWKYLFEKGKHSKFNSRFPYDFQTIKSNIFVKFKQNSNTVSCFCVKSSGFWNHVIENWYFFSSFCCTPKEKDDQGNISFEKSKNRNNDHFSAEMFFLSISQKSVRLKSHSLKQLISATYFAKSFNPFFPMFPFDLPENIRKAKVFWSFQEDQMETFGRKGLSGNCEVIYFYSRKCSSSHLELLPDKIFLAIEVRTVFQVRLQHALYVCVAIMWQKCFY